jgi:anaerobic selenocysteine-containing dehydrogenase
MTAPIGLTAPVDTVHTFCRYCLASCGVEVTVRANQVIKISADRANPHSWHDFCAKGRTAAEVVEHPRRVLAPMRRVGDSYVEASWAEAIADIAARCNAIIDEDGPDAIGAYYGNPAGYSSSNLVFFNAWLDAVGTYNRYAVGSVDQNAVHVVAEAMYGSPLLVPVSDIDQCDYFLLVGANPAVSAWNWLETVPGGWRRALERQRRGAAIVVVDPVRTETAEKADLHLAVRPGQDWALLLAMVKVILDEGREHTTDCADLATGPDGRRLDEALARLDLLVAIDFVQRESHRHAHWILPAAHWLERNDLLAFTSGMHDEPFVQYGVRAVAPPPGVREEWRIFTDLAIAMRRPLFGARGLNKFITASRRLARMTGRPGLEFTPHWIDRLLVATSRKVNGRRLKWRELLAHPHGLVLGPRQYGQFRGALRTPDGKVHAAPPEFVGHARELLTGPHPAGRSTEVLIHPDDAAAAGIGDGCRVRVFSAVAEVELIATVSEKPRRGLLVIDHGVGVPGVRSARRRCAGVLRRESQPAGQPRRDGPAVADLGPEFGLRGHRPDRLSPLTDAHGRQRGVKVG